MLAETLSLQMNANTETARSNYMAGSDIKNTEPNQGYCSKGIRLAECSLNGMEARSKQEIGLPRRHAELRKLSTWAMRRHSETVDV
jgi:hypothetical protein